MPPTSWAVTSLVLTALISFMMTLYFMRRTMANAEKLRLAVDHAAMLERLNVLEKQLALVGQAVVPISTAFQAILVKELTHFHTPELDALLAKIGPPSALTPDEFLALATGLEARSHDMNVLISDSERDAALMLPFVMKRAQHEYQLMQQGETYQMSFLTIHLAPEAGEARR